MVRSVADRTVQPWYTPALLGTIKFPAGIARDYDAPDDYPTIYTDPLEPSRAFLMGGSRPAAPENCTALNRGRCDCANLNGWAGFTTYVWTLVERSDAVKSGFGYRK